MSKIKTMKTLILLLAISLQLSAQNNIAEELGWMLGEWEGTASTSQANQEQIEFSQKEFVRWGAGKTVLVIDGIGRIASKEEPIFNATGLLYLDEESNSYKLHSFTKDKKTIIADFKMTGDKKAEWSFTVPNGTLIYKIDAQDGIWKEKGYFQPKDSDAMYPFFEMKLNKI